MPEGTEASDWGPIRAQFVRQDPYGVRVGQRNDPITFLAANEVGRHTAAMGARLIAVALGSALLLGACGHDSSGASGEPHAGPPAVSQTTVDYPQPRCTRGSTLD